MRQDVLNVFLCYSKTEISVEQERILEIALLLHERRVRELSAARFFEELKDAREEIGITEDEMFQFYNVIGNRMLMRSMNKSDLEERGQLIEQMLDKIMPIPKGTPDKVREAIDIERQMLILRADWGIIPIAELRKKAAGK